MLSPAKNSVKSHIFWSGCCLLDDYFWTASGLAGPGVFGVGCSPKKTPAILGDFAVLHIFMKMAATCLLSSPISLVKKV